jgi:hypothetical protein
MNEKGGLRMHNRLRLGLATLAVFAVVGGGAAIANAASGNSSSSSSTSTSTTKAQSSQSKSNQSKSNQTRTTHSGNCPNM